MLESTVSGHQISLVRERLADKMEIVKKDPLGKENYNKSLLCVLTIFISTLLWFFLFFFNYSSSEGNIQREKKS